ncbi:A disintegrin and metalloproteinase with thrombospondin motifs 17 [Bombyx mori]|uniref:Peptidase M12B domain-containing protein n=1 Tax=Bombyx mori TaxID=7091 RepID=A0A8R2AVA7_BOMMO|nr:A disintegrin and metalloproteinase with thrombospondin motifs 17 isoform X1 [Bombyx mori]
MSLALDLVLVKHGRCAETDLSNMNTSLVLIIFVLILNICICRNHNDVSESPSLKLWSKEKDSIEYYTKPKNGITVPIMIHLDKNLSTKLPVKNKMRSQKFKMAARRVLRDVEDIFEHSSLNLTISFQLLDVKILKNKIAKIAMDGDVVKYLKTYCRWQGEQKLKHENWWFSILFTGLDLFYFDDMGHAAKRVTSRSYMKGMCSINNSCTLTEWGNKNTAFMLAHEIAHSLGVPHDGYPNNECRGRHVMSAVFSPLSHNQAKSWSPCSRRALKHYLSSKRAWCLKPEENNKYILV